VRLTVLLFKWASPRSLRLPKVNVPKSNSVAAVTELKKQKIESSIEGTKVKQRSDICEEAEKERESKRVRSCLFDDSIQ